MKKLILGVLASLSITLSCQQPASATLSNLWTDAECFAWYFYVAPYGDLDHGYAQFRRADGTYFVVFFAGRSFDGLQPVTEQQAYAIGTQMLSPGVRMSAYSVSDYRGLHGFYVFHRGTQVNCVR